MLTIHEIMRQVASNDENIFRIGGFYDSSRVNKILFSHGNSKIYIGRDNLVEFSHRAMKRIDKMLEQMTITEQLYNHLDLFTLDDMKYHALGKTYDVVLLEDFNYMAVADENDSVLLIYYI